MWHFQVVISHFLLKIVHSAWVEIPQSPISSTPFIFATPKVSFYGLKTTTEIPPNKKILATTRNYRDVLTSTIPSVKKEKQETTYNGFIPLLKNIQETLTSNAKKTVKSKINLLAKLRDNLLFNIDERMSDLWSKPESRQARTYEDDHEMEFPSNEGALLTIGFLTFAVFLIKLVLKLIQAFKDKQNLPMVLTTMAPAAAFIGRKKRDIEETVKLLQLLEEYKFK